MLRSEHGLATIDFNAGQIHPDRLNRRRDAAYLDVVDQCLTLYRYGIDRRRQSLHRDVESLLQPIVGCPPKRIAAFCKLLDDAAVFDTAAGTAFQLRKRLFSAAATMHPIVAERHQFFDFDLESARQDLCRELDMSWKTIQRRLFNDVIELQRLQSFDPDVDAATFLSRYNLAQTQAVLYRATRVIVDADQDFKMIVRAAKLAGLMHRITVANQGASYRFEFDGPVTSMRASTRYGVRFATMLPMLLSLQGWRMRATVLGPRDMPLLMQISSRDGLRSEVDPPGEFDSELEANVQAAWDRHPVAGWTLKKEPRLMVIHQTVMTPDFELSHVDGRRVAVEVIGFWTPEYLREKRDRLQKFASVHPDQAWLLILGKSTSIGDMARDLGLPAVVFQKRVQPAEWIKQIE